MTAGGQTYHPKAAYWALASLRWAAGAAGLAAAVWFAVCTLYVVKSALGINILPGHVPLLHAALYPLVRG